MNVDILKFVQSVTDFFRGQSPDLTGFGMVGIVVTLALALLFLFFGYRLMRVTITIVGVIIGVSIGCIVAGLVGSGTVVSIILIIVFAIAIGLLSGILYKVGVFLTGFFAAYSVVINALPDSVSAPTNWAIAAAVAIIVGVITVLVQRPAFILLTGLGGGVTIAYTVIQRLIGWSGVPCQIVTLLVGLLIGAFGVWFQFRHTSARK